jgi:hypothetical protein
MLYFLGQRFCRSRHPPNLILRSIAQAMRLEGWLRAMAVRAAILRDASLRPASDGLLLRMRTESLEATGIM